jgi:hypothetical protein
MVRSSTEVFVPRGVEQVDDAVAVGELHHRRSHRDAALFFQFHPVRSGVARGLAALDGARHLYRLAVEQQFFGDGGLAGVRMRNNGKSPASTHFVNI